MDSRVGDEILDSNMDTASVGGGSPSVVRGKVDDAVQLNARRRDFIDLGSHGSESCLANLSVCLHGLTVSVWIRFDALLDNMHFLTTGLSGVQLYYRCVFCFIIIIIIITLLAQRKTA